MNGNNHVYARFIKASCLQVYACRCRTTQRSSTESSGGASTSRLTQTIILGSFLFHRSHGVHRLSCEMQCWRTFELIYIGCHNRLGLPWSRADHFRQAIMCNFAMEHDTDVEFRFIVSCVPWSHVEIEESKNETIVPFDGRRCSYRGRPDPLLHVAVLDVDMIPLPNLLRALMPHLIINPSFAMATIPQYFYNIPDGDLLCQCTDILFNFGMLELDTSNSTLYTGTGFLRRRSAADQIGGIPTEETSEDLMTSLLLRAKGWKIAYVWETLQWGNPNNFTALARQQSRWSGGFISIAKGLLGSRLSKLPTAYRIYLSIMMTARVMVEVAITCPMLFIPVVLISRKPFVVTESPQQLRTLLILSALQILVMWINNLITAESIGFRMLIWPNCRYPFLAPFQTLGVLGPVLPFKRSFSPTGNMLDGQRERESRDSKSFVRRMKFLIGTVGLWVEIFIIASAAVGGTLSIRTLSGWISTTRIGYKGFSPGLLGRQPLRFGQCSLSSVRSRLLISYFLQRFHLERRFWTGILRPRLHIHQLGQKMKSESWPRISGFLSSFWLIQSSCSPFVGEQALSDTIHEFCRIHAWSIYAASSPSYGGKAVAGFAKMHFYARC